MSDIAIEAEHLGKFYRIGCAESRHQTFREALIEMASAPCRKISRRRRPVDETGTGDPHSIWALRDVSFRICQGEVVGIIGRNGSGKSTLLKILSRITEPTKGRARIRGRVGSLLEVGTGFHSELTGEENIYLSGSILGMSSMEISRKFDDMVAFAEVEPFIHTPVKHYSSGMYMRLAFAVAAHLDPEILLIDEVLAVGDAAFQKKCFGKMHEVAHRGRTVLFVSHNMTAVQMLCNTALQLDRGQLVASGDSKSVISAYLAESGNIPAEKDWPPESAPGNEEIRLLSLRVSAEDGNRSGVYQSQCNLFVEMNFVSNTTHSALCVGFDLVTSQGETVLRSYQTDLPQDEWLKAGKGDHHWRCIIPGGLLNAGVFYVCPRISMHNMYWIVRMEGAVQFEVILNHGASPFWASLDSRSRPGVISPVLKWKSVAVP